MAQQCKSIRRKSIRHKNRTTLKRGGVIESKSEPKKAKKTSSIVYFPRTGKRTDDDEWEDDFKRLNSDEYKARNERVRKQHQLDKHMLRIPGIIRTYGAREIKLNDYDEPDIVLRYNTNRYYFKILDIPLEKAHSITNEELNEKYNKIIKHPLFHEGLQKFVFDAKNKLYSNKVRQNSLSKISSQEYQLNLNKDAENLARYMRNDKDLPKNFFPSSQPRVYNPKISLEYDPSQSQSQSQ